MDELTLLGSRHTTKLHNNVDDVIAEIMPHNISMFYEDVVLYGKIDYQDLRLKTLKWGDYSD